jgi:predicted nucleotide-binding protein (sugar kinase/HSP70/actin superfamily)
MSISIKQYKKLKKKKKVRQTFKCEAKHFFNLLKFNKNNSITLQEKPYVEPLQEINANILVSQTEFLMKLISLKKALY